MNRRLEFLLLLVLVSAYLLWFAWPFVWTAAENERMVAVFNAGDEAIYLRVVQDALRQHTLRIERRDQGHLYLNVALLPLSVLNHWVPVDAKTIVVVLRLLSAAFAIGTAAVAFLLARRYFGRVAGWLTVALLLAVPVVFLHWAGTVHSDMVQLFFLTLGLYLCCRLAEGHQLKYLVGVSIAAGCAFASKYVGVMLLPVLWLTEMTRALVPEQARESWSGPGQSARLNQYVMAAFGMLCIVLGVVLTPELVASYTRMRFGSVSTGHWAQLWDLLRLPVVLIGCGAVGLAVRAYLRPATLRGNRWVDLLARFSLSVMVFGLVAFLCSPLAFDQMIQGGFFQSAHVSFGETFAVDRNPALWFGMLMSPSLLGGGLLAVALISLVMTLSRLIKDHGRRSLLRADAILWAWVILYMALVSVQVAKYSPRYLLPVIPFLMILCAALVSRALAYASGLPNGRARTLALGAMAVVIALGLGLSLGRAVEYRQAIARREETSPAIQVGKWLAANYPASARVFYDMPAYVPPSFSGVRRAWEGTLWVLRDYDPDVVIVNQGLVGTYFDLRRAPQHRGGEVAFHERHEYYRAFREGWSGYELVRDFGDFKVYGRERVDFALPPAVHQIEGPEGQPLTLWSYSVEPKQVRPGGSMQVNLYWQSDAPLPEDKYGVFLHLRDGAQSTVAQADWHFLTGKRFPEVTRHTLSIPPEVASGDYEIRVGVYRTDTMERLPVIGDVSGENAIILPKVAIR